MLHNPGHRSALWLKQAGTNPLSIYYTRSDSTGGYGTTALIAGTLYAIPYYTGRGGIIDRIATEITIGGAGGKKGRLGVYGCKDRDLNIYPGALIVDGGEIAIDAAAVVAAVVDTGMPIDTMAWLVCLLDDAATLRANYCDSKLLGSAGGGAPFYNGIKKAQAYGALPATFPAGGVLDTAIYYPIITLRYSA